MSTASASQIKAPLAAGKMRLGVPALVFLTALPFLPSLNNQFVNWDDPVFVGQNLHIRDFSAESLKWMFSTYFQGNWTPLTWLSFALDYQIGGLQPWIYHLSSLLLHCANTLLVFLIAGRILNFLGNRDQNNLVFLSSTAFLTALLFGLHPLHVEPVAWVTDRIDLLCAFFYLLSLFFYLRVCSRENRKTANYLFSLLFFIMALSSKSMALSLPLVFLILDGWPLNRFKAAIANVFIEKIPYFIVAVIFSFISIQARSQAGSVADLETVPFDFRIMNALHSFTAYLWKTIVPTDLGILYPVLLKDTFSVSYIVSAIVAMAVGVASMICYRTRPFITAAVAYYLATWLPASGLLHVGSQATADRYFYLPSVGPFFLLAAGFAKLIGNRRKLFAVFLSALWIILAGLTLRQANHWRDSIALWENAMQTQPRRSAVAYVCLGDAYREAGRWADALPLLEHAIVLDPWFPHPHNSKGRILLEQGDLKGATAEFEAVIRMEPQLGWTLAHLVVVHSRTGDKERVKLYKKMLNSINPDDAWLKYETGKIYQRFGLNKEALQETQRAMDLYPNFIEARHQMEQLQANLRSQ